MHNYHQRVENSLGEASRSKPQNPHEKLGIVVPACNSNTGEGIGRSLGLDGHHSSLIVEPPGQRRTPSLKAGLTAPEGPLLRLTSGFHMNYIHTYKHPPLFPFLLQLYECFLILLPLKPSSYLCGAFSYLIASLHTLTTHPG